jgi:hypothetical protein
MSAAVISARSEVRALESASVQVNDSAPWVNVDMAAAPITQKSALCYEAACEAQLVSAAKNGDQPAFVELCRRYGPSLKRKDTTDRPKP